MKPDVLVVSAFLPEAIVAAMGELFAVHRYHELDPCALADPGLVAAETAACVRGLATDPVRGASRALIERLPKLEIVACYGVGIDAIDLAAAQSRGIAVTNTPGILTNDVADLAIGMMLASARQIVLGDRFIRDGGWLKTPMSEGRRVSGKTLGILGLGQIGRAIATRAQAFGLRILYCGPRAKADAPYDYVGSPVELARRSDFLVIACRGGPETRHLVDTAVLDALGSAGTLINVARGSVVDEGALIAALQSGRLGFAALDVFADEPRVPDALLALPNVIVQPKNGSNTSETRHDMAQLVIDNLAAHFARHPLLTPVGAYP